MASTVAKAKAGQANPQEPNGFRRRAESAMAGRGAADDVNGGSREKYFAPVG